MRKWIKISVALVLLVIFVLAAGKTLQIRSIAKMLEPTLGIFEASDEAITVKCSIDAELEGHDAAIDLTVSRLDGESLYVDLKHSKFPVILFRDKQSTSIRLPGKRVTFTGTSERNPELLDPSDIFDRIISKDTRIYDILKQVKNQPGKIAFALSFNIESSTADEIKFSLPGDGKLTLSKDGKRIGFESPKAKIAIHISATDIAKPQFDAASTGADQTCKTTEINRTEIETVVFKGLRRFAEVALPSKRLTEPDLRNKMVENGKLIAKGGYRVALLKGTPEQIGKAHGELLAIEANKCVDSLLYMVGLAETIGEGEWLLDKIRAAYASLEPFIPESHLREIDAMADAAGLTREEARLASVFPELFHCSGFALTGEATLDGKLYHGRILDYMTQVGLQDATTIFFIKPDGKFAFANVGYAGFIGSISGMNEQKISLGEMGGKGEGNWNGVPMATLMRIALEECKSLDEVKSLWSGSPRTCEYFYVFADGNIKDAVGVAATPEHIDFIGMGEYYKLLGEGTKDCVLLSKGGPLGRVEKTGERELWQV